jgi:endoglucanase
VFGSVTTRALRLALPALLVLACWLGYAASPAAAGVANAGLPGASRTNPIAGLPWGVYTGPDEDVYPAYRHAQGRVKKLLALIARRPRVQWEGVWWSDSQARSVAREYIANTTHGNPNVLSQVAIFRLNPWEDDACRRLPSAADQASYKRWINAFAAGIGNSRVALVLQPDVPFQLCVPSRSQVSMQLLNWAARRFNALPHTTVYIDVGSGDWVSVRQATGLLLAAGVRYARGFALNATHYDSTTSEILFGARVARALARAGVRGRHFVINTADNGRPFTYQQFYRWFPASVNWGQPPVCRTRRSQLCVTLGIPPTTNVASPRWHLSRRARAMAARWVDGYVWLGRPWLDYQASPFDVRRSLAIARTTPF